MVQPGRTTQRVFTIGRIQGYNVKLANKIQSFKHIYVYN